MIEDARELPPDTRLQCDVVIAGAGAAGIALALALARAWPELRLILAEAGGGAHDFREQMRYFAGEVLGDEGHPPLELYRRRMFGGTTSVWGGRCIPLSPDDLEPRPEIGRVGWPIAYRELAQYYPAALSLLEGGAFEFEAGEAFAGRPVPLAPASGTRGLALGRLERFSPPNDLARRYGAELAQSAKVRVLLNAACIDVTTGPGRRARGVVLACGGKRIAVEAGTTVIAAGGLETPRLLMWARRRRSGKAGVDRHLGRHYMTHYVGDVAKLRFHAPQAARAFDYAKSRDGVWCRRLIGLDAATRRRAGLPNFVLRPSIPSIDDPAHGSSILSASYFAKRFLIAEYARRLTGDAEPRRGDLARHGWNMIAGAPALVRFALFWTRNRILAKRKIPSLFLPAADGCYPLEFNLEQFPDPASRVTLGTERDPNGLPRLVVDWRIGAGVAEQLVRVHERVGHAFEAAGIARLALDGGARDEILRRCKPQGGHHIGTARMSAAPGDGVVGPDLEVWDTKDLYVVGSSVFPTSGFANPTLSIVALALRLAEHLTKRHVSGEDAASRRRVPAHADG